MADQKLDSVIAESERVVDIGDLDQNRNLKFRTFLSLVLGPVLREVRPRLGFVEMGRRGISPGQYFQDFCNHPAPFGYGDRFTNHHQVRLFRSISLERRGGEAEPKRIERLILETRTELIAAVATAAPAALGFEPPLGELATAGTGRVLHVLTRPQNPPNERWVTEIPEELRFLRVHSFDEPYPTIALLRTMEHGFEATVTDAPPLAGVWSIANSDVFQHVHAREYTVAVENAVGHALPAAGVSLGRYLPTRCCVIFRRPAFVGQAYRLRLRLFRREQALVALAAFHGGADDLAVVHDDRAAVFMRYEGRLR